VQAFDKQTNKQTSVTLFGYKDGPPVPQKIKNRTTIRLSNSSSGYLSEGNEITN